jgi:hypothetical protein
MFVMNYGIFKRFGIYYPWITLVMEDFHGFSKEEDLVGV